MLFPACAGVIPGLPDFLSVLLSFPRVCGGDPDNSILYDNNLKLFPACAGVILIQVLS